MPDLDVSEILEDPDFADLFAVNRRSETVGGDGRSVVSTVTFNDLVGVITPEDPSDLDRRDDGQMMPRRISIVTKFRLRGATLGFQPDQVLWDGLVFTIVDVRPFHRFGEGFVQATAMFMQTPAPPVN